MKSLNVALLFFVCLFGPCLADEADDLIKLAQSGVDEEVLLAYIDQTPSPIDLSADDVLSLNDLGVSSRVISEALRHGRSDTVVTANPIQDTGTTLTHGTAVSETVATVSSSLVAPQEKDLNISYFYEALNPYGIWRYVDNVWCWQPNATVFDYYWAPYCNHGHWVFTNVGWAWVSDYSWGWAAFHYGRWHRDRELGWLWTPGTEWGPAWVSWRTGPNYYGWAPLPPKARYVHNDGFYYGDKRVREDFEFELTAGDYLFVNTSHFYDQNPWENVEPPSHADKLYKSTAVVKNNYSFVNNNIVNHGPSVSAVAKITNTTIKPITIVADNVKPGQPLHPGLIKQNQLVMYKPILSPVAPETPIAVKQRLSKALATPVSSAKATKQPLPDQHLQAFQKRHEDARALVVKKQRIAADSAELEHARLEKEAQKEADLKKRAALKANAAVFAMKAKDAKRQADKTEKWKQPEDPPLPKIKKAAEASKDSLNERKIMLKNVKAQELAEKRKKKALEEEEKKEAESQTK